MSTANITTPSLVIHVPAVRCPKCSPQLYGNALAPMEVQWLQCSNCFYSWATNNPDGGVYLLQYPDKDATDKVKKAIQRLDNGPAHNDPGQLLYEIECILRGNE